MSHREIGRPRKMGCFIKFTVSEGGGGADKRPVSHSVIVKLRGQLLLNPTNVDNYDIHFGYGLESVCVCR